VPVRLRDIDATVLRPFEAGLTDPAVDIVDLDGVSFMDTLALGTFLAVRAIRVSSATPLRVRNPSASVRRLFELSGLLHLLPEEDPCGDLPTDGDTTADPPARDN
jgi:anti-anti-sigma factor